VHKDKEQQSNKRSEEIMDGNQGPENEIPEKLILPRRRGDPKAEVNIEGEMYARDEVEAVWKQKRIQQEKRIALYQKNMHEKWLETEQGKLCLTLYQAFLQYKKFLDEHEYARRSPDGQALEFEEHKLFAQGLRAVEYWRAERAASDRRNLELAQLAARCSHTFLGGEQCRAPRMKDKELCRMHNKMEETKALKLDLGPMEDPDSIQIAIKKLQAAVIDGVLDHKQVTSLSYLIQLAAWK
jgi:hypothetical protein